MKIGVIIPDRGDRPLFLENCLRQLDTQTLKPVEIALMDYAPETPNKDITQRYRRGYDNLRGKGLDAIAFIESDDYYAPNYLQVMADNWKPDKQLLGTSYTWYYNMRSNAYLKMEHHAQSHAMSTFIKPDLIFPWCPDNEAFTDVWLWNLHSHLQGYIFKPHDVICMGMKHGQGLTGGNSHAANDPRYVYSDKDLNWLKLHLTEESFDFFSNYFCIQNT